MVWIQKCQSVVTGKQVRWTSRSKVNGYMHFIELRGSCARILRVPMAWWRRLPANVVNPAPTLGSCGENAGRSRTLPVFFQPQNAPRPCWTVYRIQYGTDSSGHALAAICGPPTGHRGANGFRQRTTARGTAAATLRRHRQKTSHHPRKNGKTEYCDFYSNGKKKCTRGSTTRVVAGYNDRCVVQHVCNGNVGTATQPNICGSWRHASHARTRRNTAVAASARPLPPAVFSPARALHVR